MSLLYLSVLTTFTMQRKVKAFSYLLCVYRVMYISYTCIYHVNICIGNIYFENNYKYSGNKYLILKYFNVIYLSLQLLFNY